jgi:hypothetical protein
MSVVALHPNNKNQFRKYPLKQLGTFQAVTGEVVADVAFVNCSLSTTYGNHRVYIKQLFRQGTLLHVAVASVLTEAVLGYFSGNVKEDNAVLKFVPFVPTTSGTLTVGEAQYILKLPQLLNFEPTAAELEESTIFLFVPPAVTSISDHRDRRLVGNVKLGTLTAVTSLVDQQTLRLSATNPAAVTNKADKSSYLNNCPTPMILSVGGATPAPAAGNALNNGNIYLVGVKPIVFYGGVEADTPGVIEIGTDNLTLDSLCTNRHRLLPPVDIVGFTQSSEEYRDKYYSKAELSDYPAGDTVYPLARPARAASNLAATKVPEFYFWPQFASAANYLHWMLVHASPPTITSIVGTALTYDRLVVSFNLPQNLGLHTIINYEYTLNGGTSWSALSPARTISPITITGLTAGTTYQVGIRTLDGSGNGASSEIVPGVVSQP